VLIQQEDILDMFRDGDGILVIMEEAKLHDLQERDKVTLNNVVREVEDIRVGGRGRVGLKLKRV
jgi:hypothetical protein